MDIGRKLAYLFVPCILLKYDIYIINTFMSLQHMKNKGIHIYVIYCEAVLEEGIF